MRSFNVCRVLVLNNSPASVRPAPFAEWEHEVISGGGCGGCLTPDRPEPPRHPGVDLPHRAGPGKYCSRGHSMTFNPSNEGLPMLVDIAEEGQNGGQDRRGWRPSHHAGGGGSDKVEELTLTRSYVKREEDEVRVEYSSDVCQALPSSADSPPTCTPTGTPW